MSNSNEQAIDKRWLVGLFVCALAVRLMAAWTLGRRFSPETWEYEILAQNMLSGRGFGMPYREYGFYHALLSPGYTLLTCCVYAVLGTQHALMIVIQCLFMSGFAVVVALIAQDLFSDRRIALWAGVLAALHPGLLYYSTTKLHQLALYVPLFYATILLFCLCHRRPTWGRACALGLVGGAAALTRATVVPVFCVNLVIFAFLGGRKARRSRCAFAVVALLLFVGVNLPWAYRNHRVLGEWVFAQTNKGESFWVGNNPNATGGHYFADGRLVLNTKPAEMQAELDASDSETKDSRIFTKYARIYVREHPGDFVLGLVRKAAYFWWFYPQTGLFYPRSYLIAYKALYVVLIAFALTGLGILAHRRGFVPAMVFPLMLLLGIYGVHVMNFMEMRHRWTVEPVLLLPAAVAIDELVRRVLAVARLQTNRRRQEGVG